MRKKVQALKSLPFDDSILGVMSSDKFLYMVEMGLKHSLNKKDWKEYNNLYHSYMEFILKHDIKNLAKQNQIQKKILTLEVNNDE